MDTSTWSAFSAAGEWYKGNLHCHSTESDGAWLPQAVVEFYRERGYSFLALSDHRRVTDLGRFVGDRFLPLGAMEIDGSDSLTGGPFHMLAIGLHAFRAQPSGVALADLLAAIEADGGVHIFCHPYWLGTCAVDLLPLEGCLGLEVFNANCEVEIGKGYSMQCWDDALQRGKRFFGFATDDAHCRQADHGRGWIMVKAATLDEPHVMAALRAGHFYSSTGPEIHELSLRDGVARVRCTAVDAVHFVGDTRHGERVTHPDGEQICEASYTLDGRERYLRVECIARDGARAWSNPVWLR